jgi:hypothetical protein
MADPTNRMDGDEELAHLASLANEAGNSHIYE